MLFKFFIGNTTNDRDSETLLNFEAFEGESNGTKPVSRKYEIVKTTEVSLTVQKYEFVEEPIEAKILEGRDEMPKINVQGDILEDSGYLN